MNKGLSKEVIVETAERLINGNGYENLSMRELAKELNVKASSLYKHIKNMDELKAMVGMKVLAGLNSEIADCNNTKNPKDQLFQIALLYRDFAKNKPELYKTLNEIPALNNEDLLREANEFIHGLFKAAEGLASNDDEKIHISRGFRSIMHGFITLEEIGFFQNNVDVEESYQYMIKTLIDSLGGNHEKDN